MPPPAICGMLPAMADQPGHPVYCYRQRAEIRRIKEVAPGVVVDFDARGDVVGVEVFDVAEVTVDHAAHWKAP
jgi:uncharacterized protein YuzE